MIIHHTEMDATLWDDYSSRHPVLQKNLYQWNLKFCIVYMIMLILEAVSMTAIVILGSACLDLLVYVIVSFLSLFFALTFGVLTIKWHQNTLYYASSKSKYRSNVRAIVLLLGVMVPLGGSYFTVWENKCNLVSFQQYLVIGAFAVQMIRTPMTLAI